MSPALRKLPPPTETCGHEEAPSESQLENFHSLKRTPSEPNQRERNRWRTRRKESIDRSEKKKPRNQMISSSRFNLKAPLLALAIVLMINSSNLTQLVSGQANEQPPPPTLASDGREQATNTAEVQSEQASQQTSTTSAGQHQQASEPKNSQRPPVATGRQSRIYRIRAIGSNGSFAGSPLRINPISPRVKQPGEVGSAEEPNEREGQFGARQQQQTSAKLVVGSNQNLKQQQASNKLPCVSPTPANSGLELEPTASEASSISASSPMLRLTSKTPAGNGPAQPPQTPATRGELDESLLPSLAEGRQPASGSSSDQTVDSTGTQLERPNERPLQSTTSAFESILSLIDEFDSKIATNKTEAQLSCDSGEMVVSLNFTEPFRGVVYPDHNRLSPCRFFGDGHHNYELRLPLRACGTRQVAPRVFVNDVIVRFHKTLELEEDEVKTLICRYPPPLDAANLAIGSGQLHGFRDSNRPALTSTGEHHPNGHQPFELVDPFSGRPTTNRLGGQQPETFGELLAPSNGRQRVQTTNDLLPSIGSNLSPADRILNRQPNEQLLSTPSGVKQLNSRLFQLESPTRFGDQRTSLAAATPSSSSSSSSFFGRLTSIELLFLISSFMFLVLLAFGLAGSYYCFNRRQRRRGTPRMGHSAPKLLARQRRRQSYLNSPTSLLANATTTTTQPTSGATNIGRPYLQPHPKGPLLSNQPKVHQQNLHNAFGLSEPGSYYQQYLQQTQGPSSPDDSDISGQNLLPASNGIGSASPRGMGNNHRPLNMAPIASAHYRASTLRPHHHQHYHQQAVVGRRQIPEDAGNEQVTGRRPVGQSSILTSSALNLTNRHQQQKFQPKPLAVSTLGRREAGRLIGSGQPQQLINLSSGPDNNVHYQYKSQRYNGHEDQLKRSAALPPPIQANKAIAANLYHAQMRHAKSLQQLRDQQQQESFGIAPLNVNERQRLSYLNDDKIRQKQQQHFFDTSTLTRTDRTQSSEFRKLDVSNSSSSASSTSDSEIELTNDRQSERPRLVLKSIEDSFVTNLTEIYEQEYKKRDSTRPLSLAEWRSRQPNRAQAAATKPKSDQVDANYEDDADDQEDISRSNQTNLRSLTELDVNFAKSLLRPTLSARKSTEATKVAATSQIQASTTSSSAHQETTRSDKSMGDLVISPEYNCGQLKLTRANDDDDKRRTTGAKSPGGDSHESISYV